MLHWCQQQIGLRNGKCPNATCGTNNAIVAFLNWGGGGAQRKNSGLDYNTSIRFPSGRLLKGLCVLCAQRQKRKIDQEGKGGVMEGGWWLSRGDILDICQWCTSARQCLSHAGCWHTGSCGGPPTPSLSINTDTAARLTPPPPPHPPEKTGLHHTVAQTSSMFPWK